MNDRRDTVVERMQPGHRALSSEQFGFKKVDHSAQPDDVVSAHVFIGANSFDDPTSAWRQFGKQRAIKPDEELHTTQTSIDATHVEKLAAAPLPKNVGPARKGVRVYERHDGTKWVLDGHHRLAAARRRGEPIRGRVIKGGPNGEMPWDLL